MTVRPRLNSHLPILALLVTGATLWSFGSGLGNTDALVARGFATALETGGDDAHPAARKSARTALVQLSGSEEFWLDQNTPLPGTRTVAWIKPMVVGDRITIASGGRDRVLDVVDIQPVTGALDESKSEKTQVAGRLMLVTCREPNAQDAATVRFVIESDGSPDGQKTARTPHTL